MSPESNSDLQVAFLGYSASEARVLASPELSLADNRMQQGYIQTLKEQFGFVKVVSTVSADHDDLRPRKTVDDGIETWHIGFWKWPVMRQISKPVSTFKALSKWARVTQGGSKLLVVYNTFTLYGLIGFLLKVIHGVKFAPVVITLPYEYTTQPSLGQRVQRRLSKWLFNQASGTIVISPFLSGRIGPDHVDVCVVRGGISQSAIPDLPEPKSAGCLRKIVYAGTLYERYHLDSAVEMLKFLPEEYELHIYGRGPMANEVADWASKNSRIWFHGSQTADETKKALAEADLLLVLLDPKDQLARFTFPSKVFESIASGRPVLITDLPTLDDDMRECLIVTDSLEPAHLAGLALTACERSESEQAKRMALSREYLTEHATWSAVGKRLKAYLEEIVR